MTRCSGQNSGGAGQIIFCYGTTAARDICILTKSKVQIEEKYSDEDGRSLICSAVYKENTLAIANIYAPNSDDPEYFVNLFNQLQNLNSVEFIIMGDFNLVLDENLDCLSAKNYTPKACKMLQELIETYELVDIW